MQTTLIQNEAIISSHNANLMRGIEGVGGKLYITNLRLVFESHSFNIQTGSTVINIKDITGVDKIWSKFLGLPLFPNGLRISVSNENFDFVVNNRTSIIETINKSKSQLHG